MDRNIQPDLDDHVSSEWTLNVRQQLEQGMIDMDQQQQRHQPQPSQQFQPILPADADNNDILTAATAAANAAAAKASHNHTDRAIPSARLKISRACDECRRKKIRCDADPESDASSCSPCRKTNAVCQFSRVPAKRGPSKGYIKDLAERVSYLESAQEAPGRPPSHGMQAKGPGLNMQDLSFLSAPDGQVPGSRTKRSFSQATGRNDHYTASGRTGFPPEQQLIPLDTVSFERYDKCIHMTLPVLPRVAEYVRTALLQATQDTKDAFLAAFHATMDSVVYISKPEAAITINKAYQAYLQSHWADTPNLFQLQTLLFFVIESSNRGFLVINGGHGTSPWDYINQAVTKCMNIPKLDFAFEPNSMNGELDMQYRIARGTLISMMILDAFLTFADKKHGPAMEYKYITIADRDLEVVGQRTYRLARLAYILQRIANVRIEDQDLEYAPLPPTRNGVDTSKVIKLTSSDINIMTRFKEEDIRDLRSYLPPDDPILQMAFWYTRLQIEVHYYPLAAIRSVIYPCRKIIDGFVQLHQLKQQASLCPLLFHFSGLVAHILIQLCEFVDTKAEALALLERLDQSLQEVVSANDTGSFDAGVRDVVNRKYSVLTAAKSSGEDVAIAAGAASEENGTVDALQAAAEAAAKAAQAQIMASARVFTGNKLSQEGYLTSLLVSEL